MYAPRTTTKEHHGQLVFYLNPALTQPRGVTSSVVLLRFSADSESDGLTVAALPSRSQAPWAYEPLFEDQAKPSHYRV